MKKYQKHFCMNVDNAIEYTKNLNIFSKDSILEANEIGDGNINYIYKVIDKKTGKSIILKQADKFLRSSGRPLNVDRNRIESEILKLEWKLCPNFVPKIFYYDEIMSVIVMEDISDYKNLRKELMKGKIFNNFDKNISKFLVDTLLPTTDLILNSDEKKDFVKKFINKDLCDISECLVFTEPYTHNKSRNIIIPENKEFVEKNIYSDKKLHLEVAKLKNNFMNNAQALLHGDLHSGSIFINEKGIKVIDPEFSFYGPMGYDIGNVIGNLFFALISQKYLMNDSEMKKNFLNWLSSTIINIFNMTKENLSEKFDELVKDQIYKNNGFKNWYIDCILTDAIGCAGLEIIRRVVGDSKVIEITQIENVEKRVAVERELINIGINFIKNRKNIKKGRQLIV